MRDWIQRRMPTEASLRARAGLRWLAPLFGRRALWLLNRRRVALGAAIGVFCGLMIPVAQIAGAAVLALMLRGNLPVAAVATLVTNPITFGPIYVLAYRTGAAVLGERVEPAAAEALSQAIDEPADEIAGVVDPGWIERAREIGKPLFLGLAIFAVVGSLATWVLVHVLWIVVVWLKRSRRTRARR